MVLVAWRFRRQRVRSRLTANKPLQCHLSESFIKILLAYHSASAALFTPIRPYADTPIRSSSLFTAPLRYASSQKGECRGRRIRGPLLAAAQGCSIGDI